MRLSLEAIQDYISGLGIVGADQVYIGKLDNKKERSIGIYSRKSEGPPITALGGIGNSSYDSKPVSILLHWNRDKAEAEKNACNLFDRIKEETQLMIGTIQIQFIRFMVPEPQDVGTDDSGIYEYVIWLDFIYNKEV